MEGGILCVPVLMAKKKPFSETKRFHLLALCVYPIVASIFSLGTHATPLTSTLIFLFIPCAYLTLLLPDFFRKGALFSTILAIPFIIIVDYVGQVNGQWFITQTAFPLRLLGIVALEDVLWAFLLSYFMLAFYEYFFDTHRDRSLWPSHLKYLILILTAISFVVAGISAFTPQLLHISYFYLRIGLIGIFVPMVGEFLRRPKLIYGAFLTGAYFFVFALVYELTALKLDWLIFPGKDFIGWVTIFGASFPFEEFFFWIILTAMSSIAYYEFFDDNER